MPILYLPRSLSRRRRRGFSLVEMIGVLAIIAILAVVIVPKVFSTIASSRITNAVGSVTSMKTAVAEFAGKYGTIPVTNANQRIDDLLVAAGIMEGRFAVKVGTQPSSTANAAATWAPNAAGVWTPNGGASQSNPQQTRLICLTATTAVPSAAAGANFRLDGTNNLPTGSRVVSAVIAGVTGSDAREISLRIDGDLYTETAANTADARGKVVYAAPAGAAATTTVYIYVAHQ